jgi:DNA-binding XRE family transcriptional regulator
LRALRLAAALSQDDLALKAGVSRATIVRGERGDHIRLSSVRQVARVLRVKPTALYGNQTANP